MPCPGLRDGGDQRHRQRIDERRRQHEQRHAEGVLAVQLRGGLCRQAQPGLQGAQHQRLIQQRHQAHGAARHRDGHADPQQLPQRVPYRLQRPAALSGTAAQRPQQEQQAQRRAAGNARDGSGGAGLRGGSPAQQKGAQSQTHRQLAGGFDDLADGGGGHVSQPLGIAPDGGGETHAQHRRRQHPDRRCRHGVVERSGHGFWQQEHQRRKHQSHDAQQRQRAAKDAPGLTVAAHGLRLCHQPRGRQRQPRRGQHQQQVIDVVGGVEVGHALTVQQVAQWDLVQRPQHLGDGHSAGQNGRAAQKTLSARQSATSLNCHCEEGVSPTWQSVLLWHGDDKDTDSHASVRTGSE